MTAGTSGPQEWPTSYPFSAVVGLDELRLALLLNAVSPEVGGVLVRGEKGTAKSTVVRALATLLPDVAIVAGCRFACDPAGPDPQCPDGPHERSAPVRTRPARLVELPIGATEDRLLGALDLERALAEGVKAYEPGLLAAAHRGVLYVDEVNLLHDSLVDLLLDAAAMGRSYIEREGVSVSHAARFLLVGTMNPEEGELRPQLLDRFGLTVDVRASRDVEERAEVVRRRLAYDADPAGFAAGWTAAEAEVRERILVARRRLPAVELPDAALRQVTSVCAAFDVDGLRADLVTARAAMASAAWSGRPVVSHDDVRQAALLALPHRRRRDPFDSPGLDPSALDDALHDADDSGDDPEPPEPECGPGGGGGGGGGGGTDSAGPSTTDAGQPAGGRGADGAGHPPGIAGAPESVVAPTAPFRARPLTVPGVGSGSPGRRSRARGVSGRTVGWQPWRGDAQHLHLAGTLLAAAPHQRARGRVGARLELRGGDLRAARREGREGNLVLFVVDGSGSMAARARMGAVKGAVLSLLMDAYQRRDKVGLVTFRGRGAQVALPPTSSVEAGVERLRALPTGGRTPLAAGLLTAYEVLRRERLKDARRRALLVVVTDGRATGGTDPIGAARRAAGLLARAGVGAVVVDCEDGPVRLGLARQLAASLGAPALRLPDLAADGLATVVRNAKEVA